MMGVRISIRVRCTTVCDKVCQWLATGRWFSLGPPVSSTNKTLKYCQTPLNKQANKQSIAIILHMCVTMRQTTLTHSYHLIHVCHNDRKYFGALLSFYTWVSQWRKVLWHIAIILYMCVTMTQRTLAHCYNLIHVCHNDTKNIDTLL